MADSAPFCINTISLVHSLIEAHTCHIQDLAIKNFTATNWTCMYHHNKVALTLRKIHRWGVFGGKELLNLVFYIMTFMLISVVFV